MICKGSAIASIQHARVFARHLVKKENTVVEVREAFGFGTIEDDLVDLQLQTRLTRGHTGIFHVAIGPRKDEYMREEEWDRAITIIEEEFGLTGQDRIQVYHEKDGRPHLHVFWSLVNQQERKLIQIRYYKRRLQKVADQMEQEFGHKKTRRTANEYTLEISDADRMRKARTGKNPLERKRLISQLWRDYPNPQDFIVKIKDHQYIVAQGDRSRYVLVDRNGEIYNLVRQLPKLVKQKDVHARFGGLYQSFPTVEQAVHQQKEQLAMHKADQDKKLDQQIDRIRKKRKQRLSRER